MSTAYGYARISHHDGFKVGDSIASQQLRIEGYFKMMLEPSGVTFGGVHTDGKNCSASKVKFHQRPAGKALVAMMKPGDHLVIDKLDRLWRSLEDFCRLMRWFKSQRIQVHIVDMRGCSVQMGTPMGDFMLQMMVSIAQLEASMISTRTKQALEAKRRAGVEPQAFRGSGPFGIKVTGTKANRVLHWDWQKRGIAWNLIEYWMREWPGKVELDRVCSKFSHLLDKNNMKSSEFNSGNGFRRLMRPEICFRAMKIEDPNQLRHPEMHRNYWFIWNSCSLARPDRARMMMNAANLEEALEIAASIQPKKRTRKPTEEEPISI